MVFNSDSLHTEYLAACHDDNTGEHEVAYGTIESRRMRYIGSYEGPVLAYIETNNIKSIRILQVDSVGKCNLHVTHLHQDVLR